MNMNGKLKYKISYNNDGEREAEHIWYKNGSLLTGETNQTYTPTDSGMYIVKTTDAVGCVYQYSQGHYFASSTTNVNRAV